MPYIHVQANIAVSEPEAAAVKTLLGQAVTALPGKTERWLMVRIEPECRMWFAGDDAPCAMVEVSVYGGAPSDAYDTLTARICEVLDAALGLPPERIYVRYAETPDWGWNSSNF